MLLTLRVLVLSAEPGFGEGLGVHDWALVGMGFDGQEYESKRER